MGGLESALFEIWFATTFETTVRLFQAITRYFSLFYDNLDIKVCGTHNTLPLEVILKVLYESNSVMMTLWLVLIMLRKTILL